MKRSIPLIVLLALSYSTLHDSVISLPPAPSAEQIQYQQITSIVQKYRVTEPFAREVVLLTHKYGNSTFPKSSDLLAIIGIESSFRPNVKSKLKRDKAEGLTQIRPNVWRHMIKPGELTSIENQVKYASKILTLYHSILGDVDGTVNAYNVGLTAHRRGDTNPRYVSRYHETKAYML